MIDKDDKYMKANLNKSDDQKIENQQIQTITAFNIHHWLEN